MKLDGVGIGVVGPPRSGTSSAALFLERAGCYLGVAEDISAVDQFNPNGYREHRHINFLNQETDWIFRLPGETLPVLPEAWQDHPLAAAIVARTRKVFEETFGGAPFWAWKDPRTTRLLPIYRQAFSGLRVGYLAMVRRPESCARSIARRDGCSLDVALGIWIDYTLSALRYLSGIPCRFVNEDQWLENPKLAVEQLLGFLEVDPSRLALAPASAAVRAELRTSSGEQPVSLKFAEDCYQLAYRASVDPQSYLNGDLDREIQELWFSWQAWSELRNARTERLELSLKTLQGWVPLVAAEYGPPWKSVEVAFDSREARREKCLKIEPLGTTVFIRSASVLTGTGRELPMEFVRSTTAFCGWSPDGVCRICPWTNDALQISLPRDGVRRLKFELQAYFTTTSAIVEAMGARS